MSEACTSCGLMVAGGAEGGASACSPIERPPRPPRYGTVTIRELVDADDPVRYGDALRGWARSTWDAYASLHSTARGWIAEAVARAQ